MNMKMCPFLNKHKIMWCQTRFKKSCSSPSFRVTLTYIRFCDNTGRIVTKPDMCCYALFYVSLSFSVFKGDHDISHYSSLFEGVTCVGVWADCEEFRDYFVKIIRPKAFCREVFQLSNNETFIEVIKNSLPFSFFLDISWDHLFNRSEADLGLVQLLKNLISVCLLWPLNHITISIKTGYQDSLPPKEVVLMYHSHGHGDGLCESVKGPFEHNVSGSSSKTNRPCMSHFLSLHTIICVYQLHLKQKKTITIIPWGIQWEIQFDPWRCPSRHRSQKKRNKIILKRKHQRQIHWSNQGGSWDYVWPCMPR